MPPFLRFQAIEIIPFILKKVHHVETVTGLDEAKILGYFESIKGNFLLKLVFLTSFLKQNENARVFEYKRIPPKAIEEVQECIDYPLFYKALKNENQELFLNYQEELIGSSIIYAWNIFEHVTKDLTKMNYSLEQNDMSVCYQNGMFQFTSREKKDIELFYYFRNAIHHYNGAYYASKDINHRYKGVDFKSVENHGQKVIVSIGLAWDVVTDLECHTMKAWAKAKQYTNRTGK